MTHSMRLRAECAVLFGGVPAGLAFLQMKGGFPFFPVLILLALVTLAMGHRDPNVSLRPETFPMPGRYFMLKLTGVTAALLLVTIITTPNQLFALPLESPALWVKFLLIYPLLSVIPQEFLYRTFFMQRYKPLFASSSGLAAANVLLFAWGHLFFLNITAIVLTLIGGLLFTQTWFRTRSFMWVCIEHTLYGYLVFTIGLGESLSSGSLQTVQSISGG